MIGIISGIIATTIESIGDYYNAARLCGAKPPPSHSLNRGIAMEGFGTFLAGLFGSGNGSTSYSGNIALIGITKVCINVKIIILNFIDSYNYILIYRLAVEQ